MVSYDSRAQSALKNAEACELGAALWFSLVSAIVYALLAIADEVRSARKGYVR